MFNVKQKITNALGRFSSNDGIEACDVRVRIEKNNGSLKYYLMNKTDTVRETDLKEILDIGFVDVFGLEDISYEFLHKNMGDIISRNGISEESANVRVFIRKDNSPSAHLFNGTSAVKGIDINQLLN